METSTIIFAATLVVAFVFLRWLITPIPHATPHEIEEVRRSYNPSSHTSQTSFSNGNSTPTTRSRPSTRQVTDSMIEVVQAIAPQLTPGQIRYDLESSGSVEDTVNRYMETGSLPFPPGESAPAPPPAATDADTSAHNIPPSTVSFNLLEKYGIDPAEGEEGSADAGWGSNKQERTTQLQRKRQQMILNARKRLATSLANDLEEHL
ncbi:coupling of ubiquitin conjugation to ER degradation [Yamadazyma tenuis]|uniref:Coupling of ubiquitin conjugation to ER degradation protein 1 n=1 Tax=Candida tenuis (strain ATCC 10573 / BCRC 21748 / CBS 615 / JCM 9827 / NBRC 10315 / NRRL Y-1498 / VKM Y-70) TaxID=590646 RepID=G3B679_CANTC|nr:coupling of ubiquitin conjugation to ER degradation protein 1 [Yamadazyma tenuis ATCC 10573]XP_006687450.1 uncharacterized protein CANTEDRAFT_114713 [Yamadazyma tenuis ATCC 10573]EGV63656.1 coupling of ubiquitin conjugation to ER degradation protein 1 [Yamadazyma tenuis ATCC 10573]EGV63657.1 hypothetical protein CANTEDRAFT_114713 [Yamadazyma tenuis ATCC 10573]WEJ96773.1 coupling of ubiquitin conjugation to ER degradation [Yamadazyma tenuis]